MSVGRREAGVCSCIKEVKGHDIDAQWPDFPASLQQTSISVNYCHGSRVPIRCNDLSHITPHSHISSDCMTWPPTADTYQLHANEDAHRWTADKYRSPAICYIVFLCGVLGGWIDEGRTLLARWHMDAFKSQATTLVAPAEAAAQDRKPVPVPRSSTCGSVPRSTFSVTALSTAALNAYHYRKMSEPQSAGKWDPEQRVEHGE